MKSITIAAVQMEIAFCDVEANLRAAEEWIRQAQKLGADWIILPEFFTSGLAWDPRMCDAWVPLDGKPMQMFLRLAKQGGSFVGGSYLAHDGNHIRNTSICSAVEKKYPGSNALRNHSRFSEWTQILSDSELNEFALLLGHGRFTGIGPSTGIRFDPSSTRLYSHGQRQRGRESSRQPNTAAQE